MDLSAYTLAPLHQDGEFVLCRGRAIASPPPHPPSVLVSVLASEHPVPARVRMLELELAFRDDLDSTWALRPIALAQYEGRQALIREDRQGEPLARLLDTYATSSQSNDRKSRTGDGTRPLPQARRRSCARSQRGAPPRNHP